MPIKVSAEDCGMIKTESYVYSPPFQPDNFDPWYSAFICQMGNGRLDKLITKEEKRPEVPTSWTTNPPTKAKRLKFEKKQAIWDAKNRIIYMALHAALVRHSLDSVGYIDSADLFDGVTAVNCLLDRFNLKTSQTKSYAAQKFINAKQNRNEDVDAFSLRHSKLFEKCMTLGVSLDDLRASLFVTGLREDFRDFETSVLLQPSLTIEQAISEAKAYESRLGYRREQDSERVHMVKQYLKDNEEFIREQANTASDRGDGKRKLLAHDIENHPNDPTDFERTLTCNYCKRRGHAKRTCKEARKAAESDAEEQFEDSEEPEVAEPVVKKTKLKALRKFSGKKSRSS